MTNSASKPSVVVLCGGKGKRMGKLALQYKCKSLIPVLDHPILFYTLKWLKKIAYDKIFLCVDREELTHSVERIAKKVQLLNYEIFLDQGVGLFPILDKLYDKLSDRVMYMCGNQPIIPKDLTKFAVIDAPLVLALYRETSDLPSIVLGVKKIENLFRVESITEKSSLGLSKNEYYLSRPYLISKNIIRGEVQFQKRVELALKDWVDNGVETRGILIDAPYEIHFPDDIGQLEEYLKLNGF